jgi:hypothetical protein
MGSNLPPEQMTAHDGAAVGLLDESIYFGTGIIPAPKCGDCDATATAAWGYIASADCYACAEHDPLSRPAFTAAPLPPGFWYRSLQPVLSMPHTTGHLGMRVG